MRGFEETLVLCICDFILVALGVRVASRWCLLLFRGCHLLDSLVACDSIEARKEIVRCSREEIVRGTVLPRGGSQRETLVDCLWLEGSPS